MPESVLNRKSCHGVLLTVLGLVLGLTQEAARADSWFSDLPGARADGTAAAFVLWQDSMEPTVVLGGQWRASDADLPELWLARFDDAGRPLSNLRYGNAVGVFPMNATRTDDGGFLVVGLHGSHPSDTGEAALLRFGAEGELAWTRALFVADRSLRMRARTAVELEDGRLVVLTDLSGGGGPTHWALVGLTGTGEVLWARELADVGGQPGEQPLAALAGGGFVLAMKDRDATDLLAAFTAEGDLLWSRHTGEQEFWLQAVAATPDGGSLLAGDDGFLMWVDADGNVLRQEWTLFEPVDWRDVERTPQGDWLLVGPSGVWADALTMLRLDDGGSIVEQASFTEPGDGSFWTGDGTGLPDGSVALEAVRYSTDESGGMGVLRHVPGSPPSPDCLVVDTASFMLVDGSQGLLPSTVDVRALLADSSELLVSAHRVTGWPACATCSPDDHEPDDACGQGLPADQLAARLTLNFCDDSLDIFPLEACADRSYMMHVRAIDAGATSRMRILDSDCLTELASADPIAGETRLDWTAGADGLVFLEISQDSGISGSETNYELTLSSADPVVRGSSLVEGSAGVRALSEIAGEGFGVVDSGGAGAWSTIWTVDAAGLPGRRTSLIGQARQGNASTTNTDDFLTVAGWDEPDGTEKWLVARVAADGTVRFALEILGTWQRARVVDTGDGGALVAGSTPAAFGGSDLAFIRLDAAGLPVWQTGIDVEMSDGLFALAHDPAGGYVLVATDDGANIGYWAGRLDADGAVVWTRRLDLGVGGTPPGFHIRSTNDGGAMILGGPGYSGFTPWPWPDPSLHLTRLGADGSLLWSRHVTLAEQLYVYDFELTADGRVAVLAGRSPDPAIRPTPLLLMTDDAATPLLVQDLPGAAASRGAIALTLDGDIVTATKATRLNRRVWLTRLDSDGRPGPSCPVLGEPTIIDSGDNPATDGTITVNVRPLALPLGPPTWSVQTDMPAVTEACNCGCPATGPAGEVSPPGATTPLRIAKLTDGSGRAELTWEPRSEPSACRFHVYRGAVIDLGSSRGAACLLPNRVTDAVQLEPGSPPTRGWYYLVTAVTELGEGTAGADSLGGARIVSSCSP